MAFGITKTVIYFNYSALKRKDLSGRRRAALEIYSNDSRALTRRNDRANIANAKDASGVQSDASHCTARKYIKVGRVYVAHPWPLYGLNLR